MATDDNLQYWCSLRQHTPYNAYIEGQFTNVLRHLYHYMTYTPIWRRNFAWNHRWLTFDRRVNPDLYVNDDTYSSSVATVPGLITAIPTAACIRLHKLQYRYVLLQLVSKVNIQLTDPYTIEPTTTALQRSTVPLSAISKGPAAIYKDAEVYHNGWHNTERLFLYLRMSKITMYGESDPPRSYINPPGIYSAIPPGNITHTTIDNNDTIGFIWILFFIEIRNCYYVLGVPECCYNYFFLQDEHYEY